MKIQDLAFQAADCCAEHQTALVTRSDGVEAGVLRIDDDTYSVTLYRGGGLWRRDCCVSAERAQQIIDCKD